MRLQIVPARAGMQWVRQGVRIFFRMPLAFAGLFFMFLAATALLSWVPVVGDVLALALMPAATVGLMAATQQALQGKFPMPGTLVVAFRRSPRETRAMLVLGGIYALSLVLIIAVMVWMDDGQMVRLMTQYGGRITPELLADPQLQEAARSFIQRTLVACLLYLPVSVLLWHAPALVHWHRMPVTKSLFFSAVAVLRNSTAYLMFGLGWLAVSAIAWIALLAIAGALGNTSLAVNAMFPLGVLLMAMFYASLWFTFRDSFEVEAPPQDGEPALDP